MSVDEERLALDKDKFAFERERLIKHEEREEKIFKAYLSTKRWSQISTFLPILAIIIGLYANIYLESVKQNNLAAATQLNLQRNIIDTQLSKLYYPIKIRLEKDTAVWQLSRQLSEQNKKRTGDDFSKHIENSVIIPNHDEIIEIISNNYDLIKNTNEQYDPKPLIEAINQYQRHFSAYKTLRALGIYTLNPRDVCKGCEWPKSFPALINERIAQLEKQRATLGVN